jgi:hypothetical protein
MVGGEGHLALGYQWDSFSIQYGAEGLKYFGTQELRVRQGRTAKENCPTNCYLETGPSYTARHYAEYRHTITGEFNTRKDMLGGTLWIPVTLGLSKSRWAALRGGTGQDSDQVVMTLDSKAVPFVSAACTSPSDVCRPLFPPDAVPLPPDPQKGTSWSLGGGGSIHFDKRENVEFTVPLRVDLYHTSYGIDSTQNSWRLMAGFNVRFKM